MRVRPAFLQGRRPIGRKNCSDRHGDQPRSRRAVSGRYLAEHAEPREREWNRGTGAATLRSAGESLPRIVDVGRIE